MRHERSTGGTSEAGFTLVEVMVTVGLIGVLAAMAIMVSPSFSRTARADSGIAQAVDAIRSAREVAISQRRNVELDFIGDNAIRTRRVEIGANGLMTGFSILRIVELENRMRIRLDPEVTSNTPDGFPQAGAASFSGQGPWRFTSEGTFVGGSGDPVNGTISFAISGEPNSSRAVTIMGATALIRAWRWNGREFVE